MLVRAIWFAVRHLPPTFIFPFLLYNLLWLFFAWPALALSIPWLGNQVPTDAGLPSLVADILDLEKKLRPVAMGLLTAGVFLAGFLVSYNLAVLTQRLLRPFAMAGESPLRWWRRRFRRPPVAEVAAASEAREPERKKDPALVDRLSRFEKIGIICAGGGAKGVYQAAALKAITEFLEDHGASARVQAIAASSIGAWNALFWIADEVRPQRGNPMGALEWWWRNVDVGDIVDFDYYIPFSRSHLLRNVPWRRWFKELFTDADGPRCRLDEAIRSGPIHFYVTQTNVASGRREYFTNNKDLGELKRPGGLPQERSDRYHLVRKAADLETAIFASMDIPPLFDYVEKEGQLYEDGGVTDNLPVYFGTRLEGCDLLFVLPLNATTEALPAQRSLLARLYRVLDARQGIIERNAMKLCYLYNQAADRTESAQNRRELAESLITSAVEDLAWARYHVNAAIADATGDREAASSRLEEATSSLERARSLRDDLLASFVGGEMQSHEDRRLLEQIESEVRTIRRCRELSAAQRDVDIDSAGAELGSDLTRDDRSEGGVHTPGGGGSATAYRHKRTTVFAICPDPPLTIGTMDFWKGESFGKAFDVMYRATHAELRRFFARPSRDVRMSLVDRSGLVRYDDDF